MNRTIALLTLAASTACTTVKVAQRDGCWVRRTERPGSVTEELGPCVRTPPKWADDRLTRIVQECMAQDDFRWQSRAFAAWSRGEPLPDRPADASALKACWDQWARAQAADNERLQGRIDDAKARVDELKADKAALVARTDDDRARLLQTFDRLAGDLGEAAKKPLPPATATATATTSATSDGSLSGSTEGAPPTTTVVTAPPAIAVAPSCGPGAASASSAPGSRSAAASRKPAAHRAVRAKLPRCEPAPAPGAPSDRTAAPDAPALAKEQVAAPGGSRSPADPGPAPDPPAAGPAVAPGKAASAEPRR